MNDICSTGGCDRPMLAKGLCSTHYHEARKARRKLLPCSIPGCKSPLHQADLCHSHYWRQYKHGDPLAGGTKQGESLAWLRATVQRCIEDEINACVEQTYHNSKPGYGEVMYGGRRLRMHVVSVMLSGRAAPEIGQVTRHLCANGKCVNPRHLLVGTQKENADDARKANDWENSTWHGERVNTAKLTEDAVRLIRDSSGPINVLAERFGVLSQTIANVRKRRTWKHLP